MVSDKIIYDLVYKTIKEYDTCDPYEIAKLLKIPIVCESYTGECMGEYLLNEKNKPVFFINACYAKEIQRYVLAHEIGHYFLHEPISLEETDYYGYSWRAPKIEREADLFASCLLLDGGEIYDYVYLYRFTFYEIAKIMRVDVKYVELRYQMMMKYEFDKYRKIF